LFKAILADKLNEVIECRIIIFSRENGKEVGDLDST